MKNIIRFILLALGLICASNSLNAMKKAKIAPAPNPDAAMLSVSPGAPTLSGVGSDKPLGALASFVGSGVGSDLRVQDADDQEDDKKTEDNEWGESPSVITDFEKACIAGDTERVTEFLINSSITKPIILAACTNHKEKAALVNLLMLAHTLLTFENIPANIFDLFEQDPFVATLCLKRRLKETALKCLNDELIDLIQNFRFSPQTLIEALRNTTQQQVKSRFQSKFDAVIRTLEAACDKIPETERRQIEGALDLFSFKVGMERAEAQRRLHQEDILSLRGGIISALKAAGLFFEEVGSTSATGVTTGRVASSRTVSIKDKKCCGECCTCCGCLDGMIKCLTGLFS